jgi:hypothetical protein
VAPVSAGTESVVLLREGGARADAIAVGASAHGTTLTFVGEGAALLEYDCALDALGLAEGPLTVDASGHRLPPPDRVRDGAQAWASTATVAEIVHQTRVRDGRDWAEERCPDLVTTTQSATIAVGHVSVLQPIDERTLLIGFTDETVALISGDGPLVRVSGRFPAAAALRRDDGELWLFGRDGRVVRGRWGGPMRDAPARTSTTSARLAVATSRGAAPLELWAVTGAGSIERFDGASWALVHRGAQAGPEGRVAVSWIGPGEVLVVGVDPPKVLHVGGGRIKEERLPSTLDEQPISLAQDGDDVLLGTDVGFIYRRTNTGWDLVSTDVAPFAPARSIVRLAGVLWFGGQLGLMLRAGCEPVALGPSSLDPVVVHDGAMWGAGGNADTTFVARGTARGRSACGAGR